MQDYWRDPVNKELAESLKHLPMPVMINMAAQQDTDIIDKDALPKYTSVMSVDFKTKKGNGAEEKGEFIRWAMEQQVMSIEELLEYRGLVEEDEAASYRICTKGSVGDAIVFEDNVGEGGGGGWKKKLADSGGGKRALIKEFASGKNRYKRTELNKAMTKESKQQRKAQSAIY